MMKLNIGAGDIVIEGFTPIDRKLGQEAYPLAYEDESVDEIRASHVLEHFGWAEIEPAMRDWVRTLKKGGKIRIAVPDFDKCIRAGHDGDDKWAHYIMGGQEDENDFHRSLFTEPILKGFMEHVGLENIQEWTSANTDCASLPISLNLEGVKGDDAAKPKSEISKRVAGVMSIPRLAFTDMLFCATHAFSDKGIQFSPVCGAFWGQCIERTMMEVVEQGLEFVITLDYDSVFEAKDIDRMVALMDAHPEADAIAPLQMKRGEDARPMIWQVDEDGVPKLEWKLTGFEKDVQKIRHAHFGLTIIRTSKLKEMPHPWFYGQPNTDGEWTNNRLDDDIYFWEKWATMGNTLYLANHVVIGHCQQVVTWPNAQLKEFHQHMTTYNKTGKPDEAWK